MKEINNFMAVKKSTEELNEVSDEDHPVHDISDARNKALLTSIATKSPPDLYFFCWLGYLKLKKIDIGLPFQDFNQDKWYMINTLIERKDTLDRDESGNSSIENQRSIEYIDRIIDKIEKF